MDGEHSVKVRQQIHRAQEYARIREQLRDRSLTDPEAHLLDRTRRLARLESVIQVLRTAGVPIPLNPSAHHLRDGFIACLFALETHHRDLTVATNIMQQAIQHERLSEGTI